MSLTATDLNEIRTIIESAFTKQNDENIKPLSNEVTALRNDIKEIYDMINALERNIPSKDMAFDKLSLEQKLLELNSKLITAAKQAGISLPR